MKSHRILYFSGINLNPENIKILKNKFSLSKVDSLNNINRINKIFRSDYCNILWSKILW